MRRGSRHDAMLGIPPSDTELKLTALNLSTGKSTETDSTEYAA